MEKYAWKAKIKSGCEKEYRRRHDEIWQSMKDMLNSAGIKNYSIWRCGTELFGYYECEKGIEYAAKVQRESPVTDEWNKYMSDVLIMEADPETGVQPALEKVFEFGGVDAK